MSTTLPIQPPTPLTEAAQAEWDRLAPTIHAAGVLTEQTSSLLAALCVVTARWSAAEIQVAQQGPVVKSPNGYPIANPFLAVANQAMQQIRQFSADLRLTPKSKKAAPKPAKSTQSAPPPELPRVKLRRDTA